jgi:hypothetical protein
MTDYTRAKIYKIVDNTTDNIYIGSTCEPTLARRLAKHVNDYNCYKNGKGHNVTSFEIIKIGNYNIILIENVQCNNRDELRSRERFYIDSLPCVNKNIPGRKMNEYLELNREKIKLQKKEYYNINKEKIKEKILEYYNINKEKIIEYKKEYRESNKEKINLQKKEYYEINKEKIKEHNNIPWHCDCGSSCRIIEKSRHLKSLKHLKWFNNQNNVITV